jgi:hypothetical protein
VPDSARPKARGVASPDRLFDRGTHLAGAPTERSVGAQAEGSRTVRNKKMIVWIEGPANNGGVFFLL